MWRSILLKEWLKTRKTFAAAVLLHLGICLKIFLDVRQQLLTEHAEMVWYQAIHLQTVFCRDLRLLPLLTGLALAAAQFIPEILGRRLRISLHLPVDRDRMTLFCLLAGMLLLTSTAALGAALVSMTMLHFFPVEVAQATLLTMIPWFLAGLLAYLGCVTVLLEGFWLRRAFLALVFAGLISLFLSGAGYGWLTPTLPWLFWFVPLALLGVFASVRRFQEKSA